MFKRKLLFFFCIVLVGYAVTGFFVKFLTFSFTPLPEKRTIHYVFQPSASFHRLVLDLQERGLITHPNWFCLLAYLKGATNQLKRGEYLFEAGITPNQLLTQMKAGRVILHQFTLVEGWTVQQTLAALQASPYLLHELTRLPLSRQLLTNPALPDNPEGLFFPATYYYSLGEKDIDLLNRSHQLLEKKLQQAWLGRAANLPYKTPYEALIVASLIEKESALYAERPMIAGVITRRLAKHMPLQIDASIIYGLADRYTGKLTSEDLRHDTPYNGYTRRGLPPTPIASPSLNAIQAALHPDHSENIYFVAKGDGSHQFSDTLSIHNRAVAIYQLEKHSRLAAKKPTLTSKHKNKPPVPPLTNF